MLAALLIHLILVVFGCLVPAIVQWMLPGRWWQGYSLMQVTSFVWTLAIVMDQPANLSPYLPALMTILPTAAAVVFLLNLPAVVRELMHVRIAAPARVVEEDAALAAALHPPEPPKPISPWD